MAPTWAVPVLFFLQTTNLTLIGPLFRNIPKRPKAKSGQGKLSAKGPHLLFLLFQRNLQNRMRLKGPPFEFFFGTVRLFFRKFFNVPKGSPL